MKNAKDEAAKAWVLRPVVGSTHDGKSIQAQHAERFQAGENFHVEEAVAVVA